MRLAFFQAAMLTVAVQATESATQEEAEPSYFPDLLVQTASIVDFFYPFVHDEEQTVETNLAQTEPKPVLHSQVDSEALAESEVDADAELLVESEVNVDADAELEAIMEAEIESEANGEVVLDSEALNKIENECEGNAECIKD